MTDIGVTTACGAVTPFVTSARVVAPSGGGLARRLSRVMQGRDVANEARYFSTAAGSSPAALSPSLRSSSPSTRNSSPDSPLIASAMSRA